MENHIYKAQSESISELQDELSTTAFQWAKADREGRSEAATQLKARMDGLRASLATASSPK